VEILSSTEIEFLKLCCTELTYKEIAGHMGVSFGAIDRIRSKLFEQIKCVSRIGLVLYAIREGIYVQQDIGNFANVK
jgi:DNA-binding NarL/FixJ family response regulator